MSVILSQNLDQFSGSRPIFVDDRRKFSGKYTSAGKKI